MSCDIMNGAYVRECARTSSDSVIFFTGKCPCAIVTIQSTLVCGKPTKNIYTRTRRDIILCWFAFFFLFKSVFYIFPSAETRRRVIVYIIVHVYTRRVRSVTWGKSACYLNKSRPNGPSEIQYLVNNAI